MSSVQECPICLECVEKDKNCMITECGHCFHTSCILQNAATNGFQCPYCRTQLAVETNDEQEYDSDDDSDETDSDTEEENQEQYTVEYFDEFWANIENRMSYSELEARTYTESSDLQNQLDWTQIDPESDIENDLSSDSTERLDQMPLPTAHELTEYLKTKGVTMENVLHVLIATNIDDYYDEIDVESPEFRKTNGTIFNNITKYIKKYDQGNLHHIIRAPKTPKTPKTTKTTITSDSKPIRNTTIEHECL